MARMNRQTAMIEYPALRTWEISATFIGNHTSHRRCSFAPRSNLDSRSLLPV